MCVCPTNRGDLISFTQRGKSQDAPPRIISFPCPHPHTAPPSWCPPLLCSPPRYDVNHFHIAQPKLSSVVSGSPSLADSCRKRACDDQVLLGVGSAQGNPATRPGARGEPSVAPRGGRWGKEVGGLGTQAISTSRSQSYPVLSRDLHPSLIVASAVA
jgi:hypothetical protein